jgi:hypothetical protein
MSWQDYVDRQLLATNCVTRACIAGLDGNVWAKSEGFEVSWINSFFGVLLRVCDAFTGDMQVAVGVVVGFESKAVGARCHIH